MSAKLDPEAQESDQRLLARAAWLAALRLLVGAGAGAGTGAAVDAALVLAGPAHPHGRRKRAVRGSERSSLCVGTCFGLCSVSLSRKLRSFLRIRFAILGGEIVTSCAK